jgi:hypothetical protein
MNIPNLQLKRQIIQLKLFFKIFLESESTLTKYHDIKGPKYQLKTGAILPA